MCNKPIEFPLAVRGGWQTQDTRAVDHDKALLKMAYIERENLEGLGRSFGYSRATAHRRLAGARDALAKGIEEYLGSELNATALSATQLASIRRLVQSQVSVSLGRILNS